MLDWFFDLPFILWMLVMTAAALIIPGGILMIILRLISGSVKKTYRTITRG